MSTEIEQIVEAALHELARTPLLDTWSKVDIARRIEDMASDALRALIDQADREDEAAFEAEQAERRRA